MNSKCFVVILILAIAFAGCSEAVQVGNEDGMESKTTEETYVSDVDNDAEISEEPIIPVEEPIEVSFVEYSLLGDQCLWKNQLVQLPEDDWVAVSGWLL